MMNGPLGDFAGRDGWDWARRLRSWLVPSLVVGCEVATIVLLAQVGIAFLGGSSPAPLIGRHETPAIVREAPRLSMWPVLPVYRAPRTATKAESDRGDDSLGAAAVGTEPEEVSEILDSGSDDMGGDGAILEAGPTEEGQTGAAPQLAAFMNGRL